MAGETEYVTGENGYMTGYNDYVMREDDHMSGEDEYTAREPEEKPIFTTAERVSQLHDIDKDVAKLLHSAGLAVQALTNTRPAADGSLDSHKKQFKEATQQYFALLSSIDVQLRRQVYATEEAELPTPEWLARAIDSMATSGVSSGSGSSVSGSSITPLSLLSDLPAGTTFSEPMADPHLVLNIGWLNSRKDTLNMDKVGELWASARTFVEKLHQSGNLRVLAGQNGEHEKMQVD